MGRPRFVGLQRTGTSASFNVKKQFEAKSVFSWDTNAMWPASP